MPTSPMGTQTYSGQRFSRDKVPPPGCKSQTCHKCNQHIWVVRLDAESSSSCSRPVIALEPMVWPGGGVLIKHGYGKFVRGSSGIFIAHKCPNRLLACKYCGDAVRVLHEPPGTSKVSFAVLDADPDPNGVLVIEDGFAVRDYGHTRLGPHYRWHTTHSAKTDGHHEPMSRASHPNRGR
jgi:hypothetical protein